VVRSLECQACNSGRVDDGPRLAGEQLQARLDRIGQQVRGRQVDSSAERRYLSPVDTEVLEAAEPLVKPPAPTELLAFTPRLFTQLSLPYRDPGDVVAWVRRNGALRLVVQPGRVVAPATGEVGFGYPYGVVPRLLVIWMTGEVLKYRQRELFLGPSLGRFLRWMNLTRGGKQAALVRDQMTRLFAATITVETTSSHDGMSGWTMNSCRVADSVQLWWHDAEPDDAVSGESTVMLSEKFYESILDGSVPLDAQAIVKLRSSTRSPMALDIYAFLAHRLPRVKAPALARWAELAVQFGGGYAEVRKFKRDFLKELAHVVAVYPTANVEATPDGLVLRGSKPAIPRRAREGVKR